MLYIRWCRLDLARWPNLAYWLSFKWWPSTVLACWPIVELASSINIPQWHFTKVHSRRIGNKNKHNSQEQVKTTLMPQSLHAMIGLLQDTQLISFPQHHWNVRNLTLQQECYLTKMSLNHSRIFLPAQYMYFRTALMLPPCSLAIINCHFICIQSLPHHINSKFMSLSTY